MGKRQRLLDRNSKHKRFVEESNFLLFSPLSPLISITETIHLDYQLTIQTLYEDEQNHFEWSECVCSQFKTMIDLPSSSSSIFFIIIEDFP